MTLNIIAENEQSKFEITDELSTLIHNAIYKAICMENIDFDCSVSLTYTDNDGIRELNREYRNKDSATDVLSFPMFDILNEEIYVLDGAAAELGDIVISLERAAEQARTFGHGIEREAGFLAVHSILHLLGYDHELGEAQEKLHFSRQEQILNEMGLVRHEITV